MAAVRTLRQIGLVAVVAMAMLASGVGLQPVGAQDKSSQRTEKSDKQKSTEKKAKTQTTQSSGGAAPMSGFRPDPQTNY